MSDPRDPNQSGFDPGGAAGPDPAAEAQRFWGEYARRTRPGGQRQARGPGAETGNGHAAPDAPAHECLDWCPICRTADVLRSSAPPELREQVQGLQRDAMVAVRAILDAYIERGESHPDRSRSPVEDIPIE
jgi:hypothetical protein